MALVSRSPLAESARYWAQGGIAAALAADDSAELHIEDTLAAGRGPARASAVRVLCEESPGARARPASARACSFDADRHGNARARARGRPLAPARRARRRRRHRPAHHARAVRAGRHARAHRGAGATRRDRAVDARGPLRRPGRAPARAATRCRCSRARTVLATGGAAALWERTTNPRGAIGAGLSLAHAAGAALADLEFMQFHPTALRRDGPRDGFLITEAIRGEGATLLDADGERFVDELAPRDQVALAIEAELRAQRRAAVRLDMRAVDLARFPNIAAALERGGHRPARATWCRSRRPPTTRWAASRPTSTGARRCPACTRSASARAPGCTARTGWRRTRWPSASCSAAAPRSPRCDEPGAARRAPRPTPRSAPRPPPARRAPRCGATPGLGATPAGLRELLDDPFPLARADRGLRASRARRAAARTSASTIRRPTPRSTRCIRLCEAAHRAALRAMDLNRSTELLPRGHVAPGVAASR